MAGPTNVPFLWLSGQEPAFVPREGGFGVYGFDDDQPLLHATADGTEWSVLPLSGLTSEPAHVSAGVGGYVATWSRFDETIVVDGVPGADVPGAAVSDDGLHWYGADDLKTVLEPAEGVIQLHGAALSRGTLVFVASALADSSSSCEGGECSNVILVGPAPSG